MRRIDPRANLTPERIGVPAQGVGLAQRLVGEAADLGDVKDSGREAADDGASALRAEIEREKLRGLP